MGMNKQRGNMYPWVGWTWNPIRGCAHGCSYCYLKDPYRPFDMTPRFVEHELKTDIGTGNVIFVGSTTDMCGGFIESAWISLVLRKCRGAENEYLFQSKNPARFLEFWDQWPRKVIFGTTIETNRISLIKSEAPHVLRRALAMSGLPKNVKRMVSVEPIMDFDVRSMVDMIRMCKPEFVSIGADSKGHGLVEPGRRKIQRLISELSRFTLVKRKPNLRRLMIDGK